MWGSIPVVLFTFILSLCMMRFCYAEDFWKLMFAGVAAFITQSIISSLFFIGTTAFGINGSFYPELLLYIIIILIAIPVLIGITIIDYVIMCMAGSPLEMLQGPRISQAAVEARAIQLGLDKPVYVQYFVWLGQLLQGNMGYSIDSYQPVADMILSHLGPTLLLMGVSLIVSLLISVPAGIYSAVHQYSKGDYTVVTLSFLGSSIPGFFLSLLLIFVFTIRLGWLPSSGMTTLGTAGGAADIAKHPRKQPRMFFHRDRNEQKRTRLSQSAAIAQKFIDPVSL